ncbi:uncharacterized protein LY89DRAFT_696763 [Mollisia scopiformis]|uniref:Zn(2)-C6 fungal-type domain-containing protein n=1 Tax=Mollisia scopiformis TaxID=149040 RepID=A0A194XAT0_MOLSC|nr:uncharacterized protein LY89DRAFT_696763 [Mollisia scopiformis]KUJ17254.1 hypothetical protein LY89DRAFT_696763 [Mollisia scopiformis]
MSRADVFGTACKTCRRRGRKCDRSLPTCTSCSQRGVECEGYVLRWVGVAARGYLASQTSPDHHAITVLRQRNWSLSSIIDIDGNDLEDLVDYYGRELSTAFYLGNGPVETPYTCHILPLVRSMPSVRCAVAALASCHQANRLDDNQLKIQSLHLRLKATELLREDLRGGGDGLDLGCLACMLLLAQLDLCSGDCIEFGTHLEAAGKFVKSHGSDGTDRGFFEQRLACSLVNRLDVMGATTTSRMPHWTSDEIKATLNKFRTPSGRKWGFDVFYCPIDLLEYIADITILYKAQPNVPNIDQDVIQKAILLGNDIKRFDAITNSDPRLHIVEVWRLGTLLYLNISLHARAIPVRTGWNISTTWPLFQAGLLLSHEHDEAKIWVRTELLANFHTLGCFNLKRAVEVLEQVWQMGDNKSYDFFTFGSPQSQLVL